MSSQAGVRRRTTPYRCLWLAGAVLAGAALFPRAPLPALGSQVLVRAAERPAVTFFVSGDSHFGARGMQDLNRSLARQMNELPGREYPPGIGGRVEAPRGLLFMGDMTDAGRDEEWRAFEETYGLTGKDGLLRWPVFEAIGNHDMTGDSRVRDRVTRRHGGVAYSVDWEDLHVVCLDLHPDAKNLAWLKGDLARSGRERPLIIFFHYSIEGPYSDFWEDEHKQALAQALLGLNVLAIFHGHYHHAGHYLWRGHDVFLPGAPRHSSHVYLVVRVEARRLAVAFRDFDAQTWTETFVKPIHR
jgi:cytolysin (calcineurin-like family phosphatase)